jgi:WD40 repeat protein
MHILKQIHTVTVPSYSCINCGEIRATCTSTVYDPNTNCFVSAGYDGNVKFWEPKSVLAVAEIKTGHSPINSLALSTDHSLLVGGSQDG